MSRLPVAWETARGVRVLVAVAQGLVALAVVALAAPVRGASVSVVAGVLASRKRNPRIPLSYYHGPLGRCRHELYPHFGESLEVF